MSNKQEHEEQNKHKRFRAQEGALLILKSDGAWWVGRLIDIGMGGLTFDYLTGEDGSEQPTELDVMLINNPFRLYGLPCTGIWDETNYETPAMSISLRKCTVQFGSLTQRQVSQLKYFIQNHCIGEEPALNPNP